MPRASEAARAHQTPTRAAARLPTGPRECPEAASGRRSRRSIPTSAGEAAGQTRKSFLHAVHFLLYGHSKTFAIKVGGCHRQDLVGIADWMTLYVSGMNSEAGTPGAAARSWLGLVGSTLAPPVNTLRVLPVAFVFFPSVEPLGVACGFLCWVGGGPGRGQQAHRVDHALGAAPVWCCLGGGRWFRCGNVYMIISLGRRRRVEMWVLGAKWKFILLHGTWRSGAS